MANRKIVFLLCCLCLVLSAYAQETDNAPAERKNYFIKETDSGTVLYQRLSWEAVKDILGFDFQLEEKKEGGRWEQIDLKRVQDNYIDVSLPPGEYRFKVTVINLLEQPEATSEYRNFDIWIAQQPEVASISPKTVHLDDLYDNTVVFNGKKFYDSTVFTLQPSGPGGTSVRGKILELDPQGTRAKVHFGVTKISPGDYSCVATDQSGLNDASQTIVFKFQKPLDIYLSLGYVVTGFISNRVFGEYFKTDFVPYGALLRFTLMPIKKTYGSFGFNLSGSVMGFQNEEAGYTLSAGFALVQVNAVYLLPIIRRRLNFDVHVGAGAAFLFQTQFVYPEVHSPRLWYWGMTFNVGTALQVYVYKKLYLEVNLDHIIPFREGFPEYVIQPALSLGWEF